MKVFNVQFVGRYNNSIGKFHFITITVRAKDIEAVMDVVRKEGLFEVQFVQSIEEIKTNIW